MTKKRSSMQSNAYTAERDKLTTQIAETMVRANQAERQGQFGTYWHDKLDRLNALLTEINEQLEV